MRIYDEKTICKVLEAAGFASVVCHADNYIFPAAAIYLTIKEETDEQTAYAVIENAAIRNTLAARS